MRYFLGLGHDGVNPSHIVGDEFGSAAGMCFNILREQRGHITIAGLYKAADIRVLEIVFLHINLHGGLERTDSFGFCQLQ